MGHYDTDIHCEKCRAYMFSFLYDEDDSGERVCKACKAKSAPRKKDARIGHTPGPWKARLEEARFGTSVILCGKRGYIASVGAPFEESAKEQRANARLIAAAPDGLDAAERAYAALMAHPFDAWRASNQAVYCDLRDYIAKAKGLTGQEVQEAAERGESA